MDNTPTSNMGEKSSSSSVEPSEDTLVEAAAEEAQPTTTPTLPLPRYLILAGAYVPLSHIPPPQNPRH